MFIDSGKVIYIYMVRSTFSKHREELKKDAAKKEYKNLIVHGWSIIVEDWTKKES